MSLLKLAEGSTPSTPSSGLASLFAKTTGLFYSKDSNGTVRALFGTKNAIINGGMMVAQRGVLTLGSSAPAANAGYGKVDRFQCWATGTAVSAGTGDQTTTANCGRTGYALKLAGVTLTGTGIVFIKHRVESLNAVRFKNQTASVSLRVYHDVGSSINYTITVRKPTASDNYASTTVISTGSATAVATATETLLTLQGISMGDCSYGIEIEVKAECGAITTKNFQYAEMQLEEGAEATTFEYMSFEQELYRCRRYYNSLLGSGNIYTAQIKTGTETSAFTWHFGTSMFSQPTMSRTGDAGTFSAYSYFSNNSAVTILGGAVDAYNYYFNCSTLAASAEL